MAEALLKVALEDGLNISVASAGVAAMPGQKMSRETHAILASKSAGMDGFRSQSVDEDLLEGVDLVIPMTSSHAQMLRYAFPACEAEIRLMCDFISPDEGMEGADIPDPFGMGVDAYEEVAAVMDLAVPGIKKALND
ncbi:hypothetical protein HW115_10730 [Verrucomicrobiaceae bacterium N1E253]|uniref:Phosphotyrosine protein phosphatase I domain-containing protein n=2 Tax=Oceaniferula marina TaxID=2748318 RepID=A0A851GF91_9BACT|nr:hypothetical protein [Oceaniferula marina]